MRKFRALAILATVAVVAASTACSLQTQLPEQYYKDLSSGIYRPDSTANVSTVIGDASTMAYVVDPGQTQPVETQPGAPVVTQPGQPDVTTAPVQTQPVVTQPGTPEVTTAPVQTQPVVTQPAGVDVSSWSVDEIVSNYVNAVNKTKAIADPFTCHHTESFDVHIDSITGGDLVKNIVNGLIGNIVKPSDEDLNFSGGKAVTGEGETIGILLPKNGNNTLTSAGVASASATPNGSGYSVVITLKSESVDMTTKPQYNSAAIGFLDIGSIDLSIMTVTRCDVVYPGSVIEATINGDGLVSSQSSTLKMTINGAGKAGLISGEGVFGGSMTETWRMPW